MATDPSRSIPQDVATVQSLQSTTEESAKAAMRAPVDQAMGGAQSSFGGRLGGIISGIANALRKGAATDDEFRPIGEAIDPFHDLQHELEGLIDLLEGSFGYGASYMGKNINAEWGSNNWRDLPFDVQLPPGKNVSILSNGRMRLDAPGLWTIYCRIHGRSTVFTGGGAVTMRITVYSATGQVVHKPIVRGTSLVNAGAVTTTLGSVTLQAIFPVTIVQPGATIRVEAWTGAWRWWDGGARYSSLAAIRHSETTQDTLQDVVPDEDDPNS